MNELDKLGKSEDWGDPTSYDITLKRGKDSKGWVEYSVVPSPPKPLAPEAESAWDEGNAFGAFDLSRLLAGGDPFGDRP